MLAPVLLAFAAFAEDPAPPAPGVWVAFPTRAVNVAAEDVQAADALFRLRLADATHTTLVGQSETRGAMTAGTDDAALKKACGALKCTRWATLDLIRLGGEIYVTAMLRDDTGAQVFRVDVVTTSMAQFDENLDRIAVALVERIPYEKVPARKAYVPVSSAPPSAPAVAAAEDEEDEPAVADAPQTTGAAAAPPVVYVAPRKADARHGVHLGAWVPIGVGASTGVSVAYDARWEKPGSFVEFDAGFVWPVGLDAFGGLYADLAWCKLVPAGPLNVYVGAGGGPRPYVVYGPNGGFGGGVIAQAGVMNGREAKVRTYAELRGGADVFNDLYYGGYYAAAFLGAEAGVAF